MGLADAMVATAEIGRPWNGSKWISRTTRARIYARDGFRCVWCTRHASVSGVLLSLDHFLAHNSGGNNDPKNLLTSCLKCNSQRGDKPALTFAFEKDGLLFGGPFELLDRILDQLDRPLPLFVP